MSTDWDTLWRSQAHQFHRWPSEDLIRWSSTLESGCSVLEVGCGNGHNVQALLSDGFDAYGVDISPEAIKRARLGGLGHRVEVALAADLPYEDGAFDAVGDVQCLQHLPQDELSRAHVEIRRVLEVGGSFFTKRLVQGQEHYPALSFNEGVQPPLKLVYEERVSREWDRGRAVWFISYYEHVE